MSENVIGFQSQLVAIMEILVKAVVCETTKLFETGVLHLTVQIADIRKENEDLKSRLKVSELARGAGDGPVLENGKDLRLTKKCNGTGRRPGLQDDQSVRVGEEDLITSQLKEELPEVQSVLIKQEEPDSEEYTSELCRDNEVTPLSQDVTNPTSENKRVMYISGDGEDVPGDTRARLAGIMGQDMDAWRVWEGSKAKSKNSKELSPSDRDEPRHSGKRHCEQTMEYCTVGMRERWAEYKEGDSRAAMKEQPFHWLRVQDSDMQYCANTEEGAGSTFLRSLSSSCSGEDAFVDFTCVGTEGDPGAVLGVETAGKTDMVQSHGDALSGQQSHRPGPRHSEAPGTAEIPIQLPRDEQQVQPEAFGCMCQVCGRVLSTPVTLEAHLRVHTGERPYCCSECGKAFPSQRGLKRHMLVHAAGRPHQCPQCTKSFVYQFSLAKHQLVHAGQRAHACGHCDKSFIFKSDLVVHERHHTGETPYGCSICGKHFRHRRTLNTHLLGHAGEKRHVCAHCGKSFLDLGNFKRHKRIHTGEKPYSCQVCGKSFTQSAHLKKHSLTHR